MINRTFTSDDKEVLLEALDLLIRKEQDAYDRTELIEKIKQFN